MTIRERNMRAETREDVRAYGPWPTLANSTPSNVNRAEYQAQTCGAVLNNEYEAL